MKHKLKSALALFCVLCTVFSMLSVTAWAADEEAQALSGYTGTPANPYVISNTEGYILTYHDVIADKYHLNYRNGAYSSSYVKARDGTVPEVDTSGVTYKTFIGTLYVVGGTSVDNVRLDGVGLWKAGGMPETSSEGSTQLKGGKLEIINTATTDENAVSAYGDAMGNELDCSRDNGTTYVSGTFSSIKGAVVPYGELITGGSPIIDGQINTTATLEAEGTRGFDVTITSGTAQIKGTFHSLTICEGASVEVVGDTYVDKEIVNKGNLTVDANKLCYIAGNGVIPKNNIAFNSSSVNWGSLQKGEYWSAAGNWKIIGDVTVENVDFTAYNPLLSDDPKYKLKTLCNTDKLRVNQEDQTVTTVVDGEAIGLSGNGDYLDYVVTVNAGQVEIVSGTVCGGGDAELTVSTKKSGLDSNNDILDWIQGESLGYTRVGYQDWKAENFYEKTENAYELTTEAPADWSEAYDDYYVKDGDNYKAVETIVIPTWEADKYYKLNTTTYKYELTETAPADWSSAYYTYYTDEGYEANTAHGWAADTYYSFDDPDYSLVPTEPDDWETGYSSYYIKDYQKVAKILPPEWKADTYYKSVGDTYTLTKTEPEGWSGEFGKYYNYYYHTESGSYEQLTSKLTWQEGKFYQLKDKYTKLTSKPDDWDTNSAAYYVYNAGSYVAAEAGAVWESDNYYSYSPYTLLLKRPKNWNTNYADYYYVSEYAAIGSDVVYEANKYYKAEAVKVEDKPEGSWSKVWSSYYVLEGGEYVHPSTYVNWPDGEEPTSEIYKLKYSLMDAADAPADWESKYYSYYSVESSVGSAVVYGDFGYIAFNESCQGVIVPKGKCLSTYKSGEKYSVTPNQDTLFTQIGGELPKAPKGQEYTFSDVFGPWEVAVGETINGDDATLTVDQDGTMISGTFLKLNTEKPEGGYYYVVLDGDTVVKDGSYRIMGDANSPYELEVSGGVGEVGGSFKKLTVSGAEVTDTEDCAVSIESDEMGISVTAGKLTFVNKDSEINIKSKSDVIAVNVSGGEFDMERGELTVQSESPKGVHVIGGGRFTLGAKDNIYTYDSSMTPSITSYGGKGVCIYANDGGEAWVYSGELNFNSKDSYGIWVNNNGTVHLYGNDQYSENDPQDKAVLYVHGDYEAIAAMWVDIGGIFDIRGRGVLLEQPKDGMYALYVHKDANMSIETPISGGTFNGAVLYEDNDLYSLFPANHYLRYDGQTPYFGATDGTYGILPNGRTEQADTLGSYVVMHEDENEFDGKFEKQFGKLTYYYTVTDAEWELRYNMAHGGNYQLPAGMADNTLTLDANVKAEDSEKYYPVWGMGKEQGDVNVSGKSILYLSGRKLTYGGAVEGDVTESFMTDATGTKTVTYSDTRYTVTVESAGNLRIIDAVLGGEGNDLEADDQKGGYIGTGAIEYAGADSENVTAAVHSNGTLVVVSGKLQAPNGTKAVGLLVHDGSSVVGHMTETVGENISNQIISITGGAITSQKESGGKTYSVVNDNSAMLVTGGTVHVNGGVIGELKSSIYGGRDGIVVTGGAVIVRGGIVTGNNCTGSDDSQGAGVSVKGGTANIDGGCIYGDFYSDKVANRALSLKVSGGTAYLNINEAHKTYTENTAALDSTADKHHINNIRVTGGTLYVGADTADGEVSGYTHNNGTLNAEGGATEFCDGINVGDVVVTGAAEGTKFTTRFHVETGHFGDLKIINNDKNTSVKDKDDGGSGLGYIFTDTGDAEEFQNVVKIDSGIFARIDVSGLRLSQSASGSGTVVSVQDLLGYWTNAYDYDRDGKGDWARYNAYAEVIVMSRKADGTWDDFCDEDGNYPLQSGSIVYSPDIGSVDDTKAVFVRKTADELKRYAKLGKSVLGNDSGKYVLYSSVWTDEGIHFAEGVRTVNMQGYGIYGSVYSKNDTALIDAEGTELLLTSDDYIGVYSNRIRNFNDNAAAWVIKARNGSLDIDTDTSEKTIKLMGINGVYTGAEKLHLGNATVEGTTEGVQVNATELTVDKDKAEMSKLNVSGESNVKLSAGKVLGSSIINIDTKEIKTVTNMNGIISIVDGEINGFAVSGSARMASTVSLKNGIFEVSGDAAVGAVNQSGGYMTVKSGTVGDVLINAGGNTTVNGGSVGAITDNGKLTTTGGSTGNINVNAAGTADLTGSTSLNITDAGKLTASKITANDIIIKGEAELKEITAKSVTQNDGKLTMKGGSVNALVQNDGEMKLDGTTVRDYAVTYGTAELNGNYGSVTQKAGSIKLSLVKTASFTSESGDVTILGGSYGSVTTGTVGATLLSNCVVTGDTTVGNKVEVSGGSYGGTFTANSDAVVSGGTFNSFTVAGDATVSGGTFNAFTAADDTTVSDGTFGSFAYTGDDAKAVKLSGGKYSSIDAGAKKLSDILCVEVRDSSETRVKLEEDSYVFQKNSKLETNEYDSDAEGTKVQLNAPFELADKKYVVISPVIGVVGGGTVSSYVVDVDKNENGTITAKVDEAEKGEEVTFTVTADEGWKLGKVSVKDENGKAITVTDNGSGAYGFKMPAGDVTISAEFEEIKPVMTFSDVTEGAYYYDSVLWAVENDITTGTDEDSFSPDKPCSRAQAVTFLWRAAGCPKALIEVAFEDVDADAYYAEAVRWAVETGITTGRSAEMFDPDATVSRAEVATFLYRYEGSAAVGSETAFSDVESDNYYCNAVIWAAENGVTEGTGDNMFSPYSPCNRAQIVTFLYRDIVK